MTARWLPESAAVFFAVAGLLTWLAHTAGDALPESLLPLFRWELEWLLRDFSIDYLNLQEQQGETVVLMQATLQEYRVILGRLIPPGINVNASTLALHAWAHPILLFSLLAAWPGIPYAHKPMLLLAGVPWVLLAELMDIPLILWGAVEDILYWQADPAMNNPPLGPIVQHALDGGGRYGITILFALFAVSLHQAIMARAPTCFTALRASVHGQAAKS